MNSDDPVIALMGGDVSTRHDRVSIDRLRFLRYNPRVYAGIREMADFDNLTPDEQQHRIYECLLNEPSVKNLMPEIQQDGGLQEPIIIRWDTQEVIEGNSRLAVYRRLYQETREDRWEYIPCSIVDRLTDEQQTRLLGQAHLRGRTEWSPYAKALFCYDQVKERGQDISTLAKLTGFTMADIRKNIKTVELMQKNDDNTFSNFSHYDVLVRNKKISSEIENNDNLRSTLLSQIKTGQFTAQEMRNWLPTVIRKPKILRKFVNNKVTLEDAHDRAKTSDTDQKLKKIRDSLEDIERNEIALLEQHELKIIQQTVKRVSKSLKRVSDIVEDNLKKSTAP